VAEPTAVVALDTQRIMMQTPDGDVAVFPDARWADSLPLVFQARFIQGFENAGFLAVGNDLSGINGDYELHVDIRQFRIATDPVPAHAEIAFTAKLIDSGGTVAAARIFSETTPATDIATAKGAAAALDAVFGQAASAMIAWALDTMAGGPASDPSASLPADETQGPSAAPGTSETPPAQ
jgi:phospholipid/cholesterol/gamma-HCH transport system substrate-binding protein